METPSAASTLTRTFAGSAGLTLAGLVGGFLLGGLPALGIVAILILLEVSLSFDNAIVNATILERMSERWQKIFLTLGMLIAVVGMRLVFPLAIVAASAGLAPTEAIRLALAGGSADTPGTYANLLHHAHPAIAAFGGMFLLLLFLDFLFDSRETTWLSILERPAARLGRLDHLPVILALTALILAAKFLAEDAATVLFSGALGITVYLLVGGLGAVFERHGGLEDGAGVVTGKAAFFLFIYLEVLDASFSFDGVVGAFALSNDIFVIAIGLGVGAMWIRSLTVYFVKAGTLKSYAYLEHGAMWAIGALAVILLITIKHEVPEVVTGLIGVIFIAAAFISSLRKNRHESV